MPDDRLATWTAFAVYLTVMLAIGWVAYGRMRGLADYILGGRGLGRWAAALSAGASDMSGWLLLGLPGFAYAAGFQAWWLVAGLALGTWANWRLLAAPLRVATERAGDALTLPAFLERRFEDRSRLLRLVGGVLILVFYLFYTASGLVAGGKLFETVFGLPYLWAVAIGTAVIIAYTLLGGFLAVAWTDMVQALLMLAALLITPLAGLALAGGPAAAIEAVSARSPALLDPFTGAGGEALGWIAIASLLAWGLGYFGQPHILARFMAIRTPQQVPAARRIAVTWTVLGMVGATLVGLTGIGLVQPPLAGGDAEKVFMLLVEQIFHPLVAGVLLAAILAAIMSTADSQLLVAASTLAEDFYRALPGRGDDQRRLIRAGRIAVVIVAVAAFSLATDPESRVLELVAHAWAGFGASFGPALLLAVYWKGATRSGALAGMVTGGLVVLVWGRLEGGILDLYELLPGFVLALAVNVAVSLAGREGE